MDITVSDYKPISVVIVLLVVISFFPVEHIGIVKFDPRHGNAMLVQDGAIQLLVGGGSDVEILHSLARHISWFDRKIEVVVVPSWKAEDITGLIPLVDRYDVGVIVLPPSNTSNQQSKILIDRIMSRSIPYRFAQDGERIQAGGIAAQFLSSSALIKITLHGVLVSNMPISGHQNEESISLHGTTWLMKCYNETDLPFLQHYCIH
ncbi:MAG TPA: hypothetical protein VLG69_02630 [Candidatus Andersenbacteria bacterium]|nr:hypothetical protein [Candidatus Andersenbacteria bacterium]